MPHAAATIDRFVVRIIADQVVRARRVDREAEVVAVRERISSRGLVRSSAAEIREADTGAPGAAAVRAAGEPRIPATEPAAVPTLRVPVVLPGETEIARRRPVRNCGEGAVALVRDGTSF